jgi:hypothetical protein
VEPALEEKKVIIEEKIEEKRVKESDGEAPAAAVSLSQLQEFLAQQQRGQGQQRYLPGGLRQRVEELRQSGTRALLSV